MISRQDIVHLVEIAAIAGVIVDSKLIRLETLNAGKEHIRPSLPKGYSAIYIFSHGRKVLKVGKADKNSNPRYQSQHYTITKSRKSGLAISLSADVLYTNIIGDTEVGCWIQNNTTRHNILIPSSFGQPFLNFAEAYFILKYTPVFEGRKVNSSS